MHINSNPKKETFFIFLFANANLHVLGVLRIFRFLFRHFRKIRFFFLLHFFYLQTFCEKYFFSVFWKKKFLLIFQFIQISRRPKNSLIFIQHRKSYAHPKRNADEKLMMFRIWNWIVRRERRTATHYTIVIEEITDTSHTEKQKKKNRRNQIERPNTNKCGQ